MQEAQVLLAGGVVLLSVASLLGFVQYRERQRPEAFAAWRVVHAGGTAGAVQLLALAAVWSSFGANGSWPLALGLVLATYAFFLGPLARALAWQRTAKAILAAGAVVALPTYVALPLLLRG